VTRTPEAAVPAGTGASVISKGVMGAAIFNNAPGAPVTEIAAEVKFLAVIFRVFFRRSTPSWVIDFTT
jgi:hypothetical protein